MKTRAKPIVHTLADLMVEVEAGLGLSPGRQQDIASDLRALARLTGQPLEILPADNRRLRPLLAKVHPVQAGVSKKRLQNIRSSLATALRITRFAPGVALSTTPMAPAWRALYERLPDRQTKYGLSGFIRFCSAHEVAPDAVTDQVAADYHQHLVDHALRAHPNVVYQRTCRVWNAAREQIPDWPDVTLAIPSFRRPVITVPLNQFPESFVEELDRYLHWLAGDDLLADHQPPQRCKPRTVAGRRDHLHRLASAAIHGGVSLATVDSLATLVSREVVEVCLQYYIDRFEGHPTTYVRDLAKTLKLVAQHWVCADDKHVAWLRRLVHRLDTAPPGLTEKNRAMLRQFDSVPNLQRLLAVPDTLMARASTIADPNRAAHLYVWGLVIELLIYAPMRIGKLATLRVDRHLVRPEGPKGPVIIALAADETKHGRPHEYPLPNATGRKLDRYLREHRPALLTEPQSPWLWPDRRGNHKSTITMSEAVAKHIYRETGLKVTPHQFRHLAAKLILAARPGEYELARQVLGHQHVSMTVNFYAGVQSRDSVALYDEIVIQQRKSSKGTSR